MSFSDSGKTAGILDAGNPDATRRLGSVSLADVAAEAKVSRMTVSRALREAEGVSAETRARVFEYLDDAMAVGSLMLCRKKGLKIPGDIAIAGFGGTDIGSVLPARLTTTNTFRLRIGKLAAENLLERIEGRPVSVVRDVGFELVKGETA